MDPICDKCEFHQCICLRRRGKMGPEERKQMLKESSRRHYLRNKDRKLDYQDRYRKGELPWQQAIPQKPQPPKLVIADKVSM